MAFIECSECLFYNVWSVVTSVEYPGTGLPIAAIMIGVFVIGLSIRIIRSILSSGGGGDDK